MQLVIKETRRLKNSIRIGRMIPELKDDAYRELRVFSYRIIYKILNNEQVAIVGVVHSRRLLDSDMID